MGVTWEGPWPLEGDARAVLRPHLHASFWLHGAPLSLPVLNPSASSSHAGGFGAPGVRPPFDYTRPAVPPQDILNSALPYTNGDVVYAGYPFQDPQAGAVGWRAAERGALQQHHHPPPQHPQLHHQPQPQPQRAGGGGSKEAYDDAFAYMCA